MMAGDDFESHWGLLAWAVETLLNLSPGEYPPISYEQTYSAVYKCVCKGYAEDLYRRLLQEIERHLAVFSDRLKAVPEKDVIEAFNNAWVRFIGGINAIVPIFNYMARFYVETKLNLNLRMELMKSFDLVVLHPILERLSGQLRSAQHSFGVQTGTMESVIRALYTLRPDIVNELPELCHRFIPELALPVHLEELPELHTDGDHPVVNAQRAHAVVNARSSSSGCPGVIAVDNSNCNGPCHSSSVTRSQQLEEYLRKDNSMDCPMLESDVIDSTVVSDPIINPARRVKRPRSSGDSWEELEESIEDPSPVAFTGVAYNQRIFRNNNAPKRYRENGFSGSM